MVVVLIYVDDVIITGNNLIKIQETKKQLDDEFNIKDLSPLKYFLGIEVAKTRDGLVLSQRKYTLDILEDSGKLGWYLKATPGQSILLSQAGDPVLTAYCESDWLGCPYTRRSRTGYLLLLGGTPISWRTKKQSMVSRSLAEAEYRAMTSTHIANNHVFHERTKHVEMDCYFVRERVESKEIIPMKICSKMQIADLLTKGLPTHQHQFLLGKIGITDLNAPS
ncbi:uncharacterized mitochondrial protein-like protein [Tanacetum coccineum]